MGRCKKNRCCRTLPGERLFKPAAVPMSQLIIKEVEADEFEAMRLCDIEEKSQIDAAAAMKISRGTIQRLLSGGRKKIITALLEQHVIKIK
jgi:uncharacterized protein